MFPDTISTFAPRIRHLTGPEPGFRKGVQLQMADSSECRSLPTPLLRQSCPLFAAPDLQWRFRSLAPESGAVFLNPSASYVVADDWNASFSSAYDVPTVCIG
jgi:hypothetical protein